MLNIEQNITLEKENGMKKIIIVNDAIIIEAKSYQEEEMAFCRAASNMYHNPQENFDRGIAAMITAYKNLGHADYMVVIGECSVADIITSSQNFFTREVARKFKTAGIEVDVQAIAVTTGNFWSEEIVNPIKKDVGVKNLMEMKIETRKVVGEKLYRYYFDIFNYDRDVAVYKIIAM